MTFQIDDRVLILGKTFSEYSDINNNKCFASISVFEL